MTTLPTGFGWKAWAGVATLCVGVLLFYLTCLPYPMQRCDDIYFVIGAKSLAAGKGYADISRPDAPFLLKYPPAPSLTMAPFVSLVGENWRLLRLIPFGWFILSLPLMYLLLRRRVAHRPALLLLTLYALNPNVLVGLNLQGNAGLGALLFTTITWVLAVAPRRWPPVRFVIITGILLAIGFYTHRTYIVVAVSACSYLWFHKRLRREALIIFVVATALSFPWMVRSYIHSGHWISNEYEAEIEGRIQSSASSGSASPSLVQHVAENLPTLPDEIGHGLFPWSKAGGGRPWPFLEKRGLAWVGPLTVWGVFFLTALGWIVEIRNRRVMFPEWHLLVHTAMMLVFFVGFQYFGPFIPWLYLYLWRGVETIARAAFRRKQEGKPPRWATVGWAVLFLALVAKDTKIYWGSVVRDSDRVLRWSQIGSYVPEKETIYWQGLDNYAWSCWRWYDSGRLAQGLSDAEIAREVARPDSPVRYLSLKRDSDFAAALSAQGWKKISSEDAINLPTSEGMADLTIAQQQFIKSQPPPQTLWRRPAR